MGATTFTITETGTEVNNIFNELRDEAVRYYGHNPYNGSISTTSLGSEIRINAELAKAIKNDDWNKMDEYDNVLYPEKRMTNYTKEISHYNAFAPNWVSNKEVVTRKKGVQTLQKFVLVTEKRPNSYSTKYDTLTEAKREAKALSLKNKENVIIKQLRSNGELFQVGFMKLETDGKEYKSQRASKTKVYLPIYKFVFYVYAAT